MIWVSYGSDNEDYCLLVCNAMQFGKLGLRPTFLLGIFLGLLLNPENDIICFLQNVGIFLNYKGVVTQKNVTVGLGHCLLSKLTDSLEQNPSREADNCSSGWEMICLL
jgi:hypothetical protein